MKNLKNKIKNMKGITLISLVIMIIVLLILAGVVINMTIGNDGIITKAQGAVDMYKNAQEKEEMEIAKITNNIDSYANSGRNSTTINTSNIQIFKDGIQVEEIPSKDLSYKVEDIVCTEGIEAVFDRKNWKLDLYGITNDKAVCKIYFTKNTLLLNLKQNIDNDSKLTEFFTNSTKFTELANDPDCMDYICESSKLRNLMYDNYQTTQSILANSLVALSAMKNSSNYTSINKTSFTRNDNNDPVDVVYNGKAFLLEVKSIYLSYNSVFGIFTDGSTNQNVNNFDSDSNPIATPNKFISQLKASKVWCSADPNVWYYFFKI